MKWSKELPEKSGKYVVQTKSNVLATIRTIDATLTYQKGNKPKWSFSNQKFYQY